MTNERNVLLSAMCILLFPGTLYAAPQERSSERPEETVRTQPVKQLSDFELSAIVAEQELQVRNSLILALLNSPDMIDDLAVVAGQLDQIKEEQARLTVVTQKLRDTLQEKQATTTDAAMLDKFKSEYLDEFRKASDEYLTNVNRDVFLPHQRKRVDALGRSMLVSRLQTFTAGKATWDRVLAKHFKLTSDEMDRLSKAVDKASKDLSEIKKTARKNAVKQVVAVLPEKKRPLVEEQASDDIEILARLLKIVKN